MNKMEELFRWNLASDNKDENFIPANVAIGDKFTVRSIIDVTGDPNLIGAVITYELAPGCPGDFATFDYEGCNVSFFWAEVRPYNE